jgi:hypothetical protein
LAIVPHPYPSPDGTSGVAKRHSGEGRILEGMGAKGPHPLKDLFPLSAIPVGVGFHFTAERR